MSSDGNMAHGAGPADRASILRAALSMSGLDRDALWAGCISLGDTGSPEDLEAILAGSRPVDDHQYNVIAQALNDRFVDLDLDHLVPYAHET